MIVGKPFTSCKLQMSVITTSDPRINGIYVCVCVCVWKQERRRRRRDHWKLRSRLWQHWSLLSAPLQTLSTRAPAAYSDHTREHGSREEKRRERKGKINPAHLLVGRMDGWCLQFNKPIARRHALIKVFRVQGDNFAMQYLLDIMRSLVESCVEEIEVCHAKYKLDLYEASPWPWRKLISFV